MLGAAFLRIPFYPRWAVRLLGLGAVIALHPNPLTTVVFGAAVAWLGLALIMGGAPPEELPRRHPLLRSEGSDVVHHELLDEIGAQVYFFVGKRTEAGLTLLSQRAGDGERAVLAFEEAAAAEAFRIVEGLDPEWEVMGSSQELAGLLHRGGAGGREVRRAGPLERPQSRRRRTPAGPDHSFHGSPHGEVATELPREPFAGNLFFGFVGL